MRFIKTSHLTDSETEHAWDVMEQRLLDAFAAHHAPVAVRRVSDKRGRGLWVMWRAAAAAVVVLAAAITFYPRPEPRQVPAPPKAVDAARDTIKTPSDARRSPAANPSTAAAPKKSAAAVHDTKPAPRASNASTPEGDALATSEQSQFADFVALPGASALPDFESGRIMRVVIPLTGLPAFGLDMVLDAAPGTIEADVLVGQDGVPRAIRLAATASH